MNNHSYEQPFICYPTIYSIMHKKYILNLCNLSNTEILHLIRSYPLYRRSYPLQPHTIHNAIIYYAPYNYISIMYISYCYHLSITYYIIKYIIAMHCIIISYINTHIKNIPVHKYRLETYFII